MPFSGFGSGTTESPYEITNMSEFNEMNDYSGATVYFKLMNDIDFSNNSMKISDFSSYLDGQNFWVNNIEQGGTNYGFEMNNFCSIENINFELVGSYVFSRIFGSSTSLLSGATIQNVHITSFEPTLYDVLSRPLDVSCTFKNIIVEGIIRSPFPTTSTSCTVVYDNIKILRTNDITASSNYELNMFYSLAGKAYRCQQIFYRDVIWEGNSNSLFCRTIRAGAIIEQCLVKFVTASGKTTGNNYFNMFVYIFTSGAKIYDSYAIGELFDASDNYGGNVNVYQPPIPSYVERMYFAGNIIRRNNADTGVFNRSSLVTYANYCYFRNDLLTGFSPTESVNHQEGLTEAEFSGSTNFVTWDFSGTGSTWVMSGVTLGENTYTMPTLRYNPEKTDWIFYTLPTVVVNNVLSYPYGNRWTDPTGYTSSAITFDVIANNVDLYGVEIWESGATSGITTIYNDSSVFYTLPEARDYYLILKPFYVSGSTTGYTTEVEFFQDYIVESENATIVILTPNRIPENITLATKDSFSTGFSYTCSPSNLLPEVDWWTEIFESPTGASSTPIGSFYKTTSNTFNYSGLTTREYSLKSSWYANGSKTYSKIIATGLDYEKIYYHYYWDGAILDSFDIQMDPDSAITFSNANFPDQQADYVHGSTYYNGYVYGCTRTSNVSATSYGRIVKVDVNDYYSGATVTTIIVTGTTQTGYTSSMEQIKYCNGFLWSLCKQKSYSETYFLRIDPVTMDYKYAVVTGSINTNIPVHSTDDRYIYYSDQITTYKYDTNLLTGETLSSSAFTNAVVGAYDSSTMGYYLENTDTGITYTMTTKGLIHSITNDDEYLYLLYTTGDQLPWGVNTPNMTVHELHKVRMSDMSGMTYTLIPKITDDTSNSENYILCGIEVLQDDANIGAYGSGYTLMAVDKLNMEKYFLGILHSNDNTPYDGVVSYGSVVFGNYLFNLKTSTSNYIVDVTNVPDWDDSIEKIGKYTSKILKFKHSYTEFPYSYPNNEIVKDDADIFHSFIWSAPVDLLRFEVNDLDFTLPPTSFLIKYGTGFIKQIYIGNKLISHIYKSEN